MVLFSVNLERRNVILYSNNKIKASNEFKIIWFATDTVTSSKFPIGFLLSHSKFNVSINTSWGFFAENIAVLRNNFYAPQIFWIETPDSQEGTGRVSVFDNGVLLSRYNVSWQQPSTPVEEPLSITLVYDWFSYWTGITKLMAIFSSDGSVIINHTVIDVQTYGMNYLPYNKSFYFETSILPEEWLVFADYLQKNNSYNWQSWQYSGSPGVADGGGFKNTIIITWNSTTQNTFSKMVDNDSGSAGRIYTLSVAEKFLNLVLSKTEKLITEYFERQRDSTTIFNALTFTVLLSLIIGIFLVNKKKYNTRGKR